MAPWNEDMCPELSLWPSSWSRCTLSWPYAHPLTLTPPPLFTCQGREAPSLRPPGPPPPSEAPEGTAHSHLESQRSGPLPLGPPKGPHGALIEGTCIYRRPKAAHTQWKYYKTSCLGGSRAKTLKSPHTPAAEHSPPDLQTRSPTVQHLARLIKRKVTTSLPRRHFKPSNPPTLDNRSSLCDQGYDFNTLSGLFVWFFLKENLWQGVRRLCYL